MALRGAYLLGRSLLPCADVLIEDERKGGPAVTGGPYTRRKMLWWPLLVLFLTTTTGTLTAGGFSMLRFHCLVPAGSIAATAVRRAAGSHERDSADQCSDTEALQRLLHAIFLHQMSFQ